MIFTARRAASACVLVAAATLWGCGGGGGSGVRTEVTGLVTNPAGQAVADAEVRIGSRVTRSLSNGTFVLDGVGENYQLVRATATVDGRRYSGETWTDVALGKSSTVNIMVSDERFHAGINGRVVGPDGIGLPEALVFVAGPISSTMAVADADGYYTVEKLDPDFTYTVTASLAEYINDTRTNQQLVSGLYRTVSFALNAGPSPGTLPAPANVTTQTWTVADGVTRAAPAPGPYDWLKQVYRQRRGLPLKPATTTLERKEPTRAWPAGYLVEVDLFWDYQEYEDLLGYAVRRGTSSTDTLPILGILRDPLAVGYFDVDPVVTPDTVYYYIVHRLDTIRFPVDGRLGAASARVSAQPLRELEALAPAQGASVGSRPVFQWTSVPGAATYQIYVWDRFPALTDPGDPNSAQLVWPADLNNPGTSLVRAPATSQTYDGPILTPGGTYYWMVVAADSGVFSLSASPIMRFTR